MSDKVHHPKTVEEYNSLKQTDKLEIGGSGVPGCSSEEHLINFSQREVEGVVVDFSATWCGPCRMIAPKFSALSNLYEGVVFVHVDVDELNKLDDVADVSGVPTFKYFKNGNQIASFSGASPSKIEETIKANS